MTSSLRQTIKLTAIGAFAIAQALAQTGSGIVKGTVVDVSKAVIPTAKVSLTNTATGVVRNADTNQAGVYYFGNVLIGSYQMSVTAAGFTEWTSTFQVEAGKR